MASVYQQTGRLSNVEDATYTLLESATSREEFAV